MPAEVTEWKTQTRSPQPSHVLDLASSGFDGGLWSKGSEVACIFCTLWGVGGSSLLPTQSPLETQLNDPAS